MKATVSYNNREGGWTEVEVTIAPIGKLVLLQEFDPKWALFFRREVHHHDTFLPTQVIVRKPELVQPHRGKIFGTGLYRYGDKAVTYAWLQDHYAKLGERFGGTGAHESIVLVEVYSDHGDDGHVNYRLVGYRFVGEKALEARNEWRGTMDVMIDNMPGDYE